MVRFREYRAVRCEEAKVTVSLVGTITSTPDDATAQCTYTEYSTIQILRGKKEKEKSLETNF